MSKEQNEFMALDYYVRMFKDGEWQSVNVQDMTEVEFRDFICSKIGLIGIKK